MGKKIETQQGLVKVRVLSDCAYGAVGSVAEVTPEEAESGLRNAQLDPSPEAVAYAEAQQAPAADA